MKTLVHGAKSSNELADHLEIAAFVVTGTVDAIERWQQVFVRFRTEELKRYAGQRAAILLKVEQRSDQFLQLDRGQTNALFSHFVLSREIILPCVINRQPIDEDSSLNQIHLRP